MLDSERVLSRAGGTWASARGIQCFALWVSVPLSEMGGWDCGQGKSEFSLGPAAPRCC